MPVIGQDDKRVNSRSSEARPYPGVLEADRRRCHHVSYPDGIAAGHEVLDRARVLEALAPFILRPPPGTAPE